ncbi:MAG: hypothetical protein H6624_14905 [Bdellovibrionaceae bacterium]|nr:hypothetical protein [Bdellovibrionales bacterium]MCB9085633.1 hypothetical protein [Pseudobdellovibrionaceae bacterium]
MSKIIMFVVATILSLSAWGQSRLTAYPVEEVLNDTLATSVEFKDQAMVFGYYSIQSCLYANKDVTVIRHYCYPAKSYPARSYTMFSKKWGVIHFYEEDLGNVIKREVLIEVFPEDFNQYVTGDFSSWRIEDWNKVYEYFYKAPNAACWSTNYSQYTQQPESRCYRDDIDNYRHWSVESMDLVSDPAQWDLILGELRKLTP